MVNMIDHGRNFEMQVKAIRTADKNATVAANHANGLTEAQLESRT